MDRLWAGIQIRNGRNLISCSNTQNMLKEKEYSEINIIFELMQRMRIFFIIFVPMNIYFFINGKQA